jgi:hypothetical protein
MKKLLRAFAIFLAASAIGFFIYNSNSSGNFKKYLPIEQKLFANVKHIEPMKTFLEKQNIIPDFTNDVFYVVLDNGVEAVFKPDLEAQDMYGEIAAYQANKLLGVDFVPPTVKRSINGQSGSLQLYVKNIPVDNFDKEWSALQPNIAGDARAFQFVFGQWDVSPGNFLFVKDSAKHSYKLVLVDNSGMVQSQQTIIGECIFVRKAHSNKRNDSFDEPFPFDKVQEVNYEDIFSHPELSTFDLPKGSFKFLKRSGKPLRFIIWQNSLWFKPHVDRPFKIDAISRKLYNALKHLGEEQVANIWQQCPKTWTDKRKNDMVRAIMDRRDQLDAYIKNNKIPII